MNDINNNCVLVTGAAGFIGSAVARKFLSEGYHVVTVDNLSTGDINCVPANVELIEGNLHDQKIIDQLLLYNFIAIVHIAGQSSGEISFDDPIYDLHSNTQSTLLLVNLALKINCKKFIYASTMSVYGIQDNIPVSEEFNPNPSSFYSVGKLASENYLSIYKNFGINFISLRLFNVYGPGQNLDNLRQGMVSIFLSQALNNNKIVIKGDLNRFRDMVYIDDVVDAFYLSFKSNLKGHNIFNVCTGVKTSVSDVLLLINKFTKKEIPHLVQNGTPGDVFGIIGNNLRIKEALGWEPKINFIQGFKLMFDWSMQILLTK